MLYAGRSPSLPIPFSTPSKNRGREKREGEQAPVHVLEFVFFTPASQSWHSCPWSGRQWGSFQVHVELFFNRGLVSFFLSFFLSTSKLFFVSVVLLLLLSLFTLLVQTTNLRHNLKEPQKTHHPGRSRNPFPLVNHLILSECGHRRHPVHVCARTLPCQS